MKKLKGFLVITACLPLMALGLVFVSCKEPETTTKEPEITTYTVTFDINGGSGTVQSRRTVNPGERITLPSGSGLTKTGYTFGGWNANESGTGDNYTADSYYTVTGDVTLYAKWVTPISVNGTTLGEKLSWLWNNAESNSSYKIEVSENYKMNNNTALIFSFSYRSNITIILIGIDANYTISNIIVESGVALILENNITLERVTVSGGTFIMRDGATCNGSVYVMSSEGNNRGTFTMNGGTITGGVQMVSNIDNKYGGFFTMNGGTISGSSSEGYVVYVGYTDGYSGHRFTMTGGEISGNTLGGVFVYGGTFTMSGGTISGNTARYGRGGGVYVSDGTFTMSGGTISGNTARYVSGYISGDGHGGGVYVSGGTFTMSGGTISGNTASGGGGGVHVGSSGTFNKTGGIITGYTSDTLNGNVVKGSSGNVINFQGHAVRTPSKIKETTAGEDVNLKYSDKDISGEWDN